MKHYANISNDFGFLFLHLIASHFNPQKVGEPCGLESKIHFKI